MIGPAEINIKLPVGGLGRAASPPTGSGAEPWEPNAFQQKYNENGFKLLTIGGEQACCRTVALLYTPKSDCVVSAVKTKLRPARLLVRQKPDQPDRLLRPWSIYLSIYLSIPDRGTIVGWVFSPTRQLVRFLIWMCLSFKILNLFGMLSPWGSSNYRPSAPFLHEVASHVKNCHFGNYYYYLYLSIYLSIYPYNIAECGKLSHLDMLVY